MDNAARPRVVPREEPFFNGASFNGASLFESEKKNMGKQEDTILEIQGSLLESKCLYRDIELFQVKGPIKPNEEGVIHHGIFYKCGENYFFSETVGSRCREKHLCSGFFSSLVRLIDRLAEKEVVVVLKGTHKNGIFCVERLCSTGVSRDGQSCSDLGDVVEKIVERLVFDTAPHLVDEAYLESTPPSGDRELKLLYHVIRDTLSPEYRRWVEHSFRQLQGFTANRDERGHILRSLTYVLSISWMPRPLKLPPVNQIKKQLDEEFYGLEELKKRILEIVARIKRAGTVTQVGVLLDGPPGTGKTSIAKALATVLNLPLITINFSTIHDPDFLTGSARLYTNGRTGSIVDQLYKIRQASAVVLIDEVDKSAGGKDRGNPTDTLLSLLDSQGFSDTFLELPLRLNALFIGTSNNAEDIERVSEPFKNRLAVISIPRFSIEEKKHIFRDYALPRAMQNSKVMPEEITVSEDALSAVVCDYATEPGARDLQQISERIIGDYLLKAETLGITSKFYEQEDLITLLGKPRSRTRVVKARVPGQTMCVFYHNHRAEMAMVQASSRSGSGQLNLVGIPTLLQREYVRLAYECARNYAEDLDAVDITVYVTEFSPEISENVLGAAAYTAILSAHRKLPIPESTCFLGGCDLLGNLTCSWDEKTMNAIYDLLLRAECTCLCGPMQLGEVSTEQSQGIRCVGALSAEALFALTA